MQQYRELGVNSEDWRVESRAEKVNEKKNINLKK